MNDPIGNEELPKLIALATEMELRAPGTAMNFVGDDGRTDETTLGDFMSSARTLSYRLLGTTLKRGDLVAIRGGGGSRAVSEGIIACALAGFVAVPLVSLLGDSDVDVIMSLGGVRALLAESTIRGRDISMHLALARDRGAGVITGGIGDLFDDPAFALPASGEPAREVDWSGVTEGEVGFVLFSSGTTGKPKGVMHSYATILAEVYDFADQLDVLYDGHLLQPFPLGHIGGIVGLFISVSLGRDMTQLNSWNAPVAMDAIDRYGATGTGTSPYFIQTLLDERERRGAGLDTLRTIESGGGRVGRELVYRAATLGLRLSRGYGSTEYPTATTHHAGDPLEIRAESDGHPLNGTLIRIVGPDGQDVGVDEDGEVLLNGPERFIGYLSGDSSSFVDGEWFKTGDVGRLTGTGELVITGRIKEIIIRGGENISTNEVEQILIEHPSISEAAVVGVGDVKFGERAHAFIVRRPSAGPIDLEDIRRYFDERKVARYKIPEFLTEVDSLPRNGMGKVQKHLLVLDD